MRGACSEHVHGADENEADIGAGSCTTEKVWYFSFGANMNEQTLRSRGVYPSQSIAGALPGFHMTFTYNGYDMVEPRFATIDAIDECNQRDPSCFVVEGVAHCITRAELLLLDNFEGEGTEYERFETHFKPSLDEHCEFYCFAYRVLPKLRAETPGLPSTRYVKLLLEGAKTAGLSPGYLENLGGTPCLKFNGVTFPSRLNEILEEGNYDTYTLEDVKRNAFTPQGETTCTINSSCTNGNIETNLWVTIAGWIFDVSDVVHHRSMLRKMSGIDGAFYCLNLWATAFGPGEELNMKDMVNIATLTLAQREYIFSWLHHFSSNYPIIGRCIL